MSVLDELPADQDWFGDSRRDPTEEPSELGEWQETLRKRQETRDFNRGLLLEDILSLYRRGAVPLTIATMVHRSEGFVLQVLLGAGLKVSRWLRNDLDGFVLGQHDGNEIPPL